MAVMGQLYSVFWRRRGLLILCAGVLAMLGGVLGLSKDGNALLDFKRGVIDRANALGNWNASDSDPCSWFGVSCDSDGHVIALNITNFENNFAGFIFPTVGNLTKLEILNLSNNNLKGSIPPTLSNCVSLQTIDLSSNKLSDTIPRELGKLENLSELILATNKLKGQIPEEFGQLSSLSRLDLSNNNLGGPLPTELAQCTKLEYVDLSNNEFGSSIPEEFGDLRELSVLQIVDSGLNGTVPPSLGKCFNLQILLLGSNSLRGAVPHTLGNLTRLERLSLSNNELISTIPRELGNCSEIEFVDLSGNQLTGTIPNEIGKLQKLSILWLYGNLLSGSVPSPLANCKGLTEFDFSRNNLRGRLPNELSEMQSLETIIVAENLLVGEIPVTLGQLGSLTTIDMAHNNLNGSIPQGLCSSDQLRFLTLSHNDLGGEIPVDLAICKSLVRLRLSSNRLSGFIPIGFGQLKNLQYLELSFNNLTGVIPIELGTSFSLVGVDLAVNSLKGRIPPGFGQFPPLVMLDLSSNLLTGVVPPGIVNSSTIFRLDLSRNVLSGPILAEPVTVATNVPMESLILHHNNLSGHIPRELGFFRQLTELHLGDNNLDGPIPSELGRLLNLRTGLILRRNKLSGTIPAQLGNLMFLKLLDLSENDLSGPIPSSFNNMLSLEKLNVSYNNLTGVLPQRLVSILQEAPSSFIGNPDLCLTADVDCVDPGEARANDHNDRLSTAAVAIIVITCVFAAVVFSVLVVIARGYYRREKSKFAEKNEEFKNEFKIYTSDNFSLSDILKSTRNLDDSCAISRTRNSTVYKAELPTGRVLAVKKLIFRREDLAEKVLSTETETVGKIKHHNLVQLVGYSRWQGLRLLIYEHLPIGSLSDVLDRHKQEAPNFFFDWKARFRVALGMARALAYLHHDCTPTIIHRDIRSTNVLLDSNFEPQISDFGLSKVIDHTTSSTTANTTSKVIGTYGYIAPEFAYTNNITEKIDVYSYGVILLELLTGRRALDPDFPEDMGIVSWARQFISSSPNPELILAAAVYTNTDTRGRNQMLLVLKVASYCTNHQDTNRPSMKDVVQMLEQFHRASSSISSYEAGSSRLGILQRMTSPGVLAQYSDSDTETLFVDMDQNMTDDDYATADDKSMGSFTHSRSGSVF